MSAPIQVKCSKCSALLRFSPTGKISTLQCPKCQQLLSIKTPSGTNVGVRATPHSAPLPPRTKPAAAIPVAPSPDLDWNDISSPAPRGQSPYFQSSGPTSPSGPARHDWHAASAVKRKSAARGLVKSILVGCGAIAGVTFAGFAALIVIGLVFGSRPAFKSTATLAGYSADAPGKLIAQKSDGPATGVAIFHRQTSSEFGIATKQVAQPGQVFELETLIQVMKQQGGVVGTTKPVSRAGLQGVRLTLRNPAGLISLAEIYKLDDLTILMLNYVSGNAKHDIGLGKNKLDPAKTNEFDDPDAFFNSLRKS